MIEHANIFYVADFNVIGGVEQFVYEIAKKYHDYDIGVVYRTAHPNQIRRLSKFVPVYQYHGQKVKCDKCFINYDSDFANLVDAKETIQIIHAMYKTQGIIPIPNKNIDYYIAVSQIAHDEFKELTGIESKIIRNPLSIIEEEQEKVLLLISATRLTFEKGRDKMELLTRQLDKTGVKWLWLVFTDSTNVIKHHNLVYMKPRLDIRPYIKMVRGQGYGVQLSICEGDCYFTRECEAFGVPLLVTPLPSFKEQGLVEGKNCYYIPFDVKVEDKIDKIINEIPSYEPYIGEDGYDKEIVKKKSKYVGGIEMKAKVRCVIGLFTDLVEGVDRTEGEEWVCSLERAKYLEELKLVTIVEEIKKEKATIKTKKEKATK